MELRKIKGIRIECPKCETSVVFPFDSINADSENQKSFICPNCGKEIEKLVYAAYHCASEYNNACDKAQKLSPEYCLFIGVEDF